MLKVIAEDFIRPEAIEIVTPLYRELVAAPDRSRFALPTICILMRKIPVILSLSKSGLIGRRWMPTAPASISDAWFP